MKTFCDLYLHLNGNDIDEVVQKFAHQCQPPWQRRSDKEKELASLGEKYFCFERGEKPGSPSAALFLCSKDDGTWRVANIVPVSVGQLSYKQYNEMLEDFLESIINPAIKDTTVEAEMTSHEITIGSVAGEEVEKALDRFSIVANKSTGSAHPSDRRLWFEFLSLANESTTELRTNLAIRALIERGWSEERAYELGLEFEFADELLSYVRGR